LTGTPGTGKSSCAARLPSRIAHVELGELARRELGAVERSGSVTVDLRRLARWIAKNPPPGGPTFVVGHLSHLLPIRDVVLLRCHPVELARRLRNGRSTTAKERRENVWAEATDVILFEARRRGRRIWEIDTTRHNPERVARRIAALVDRPPAPTRRFVDWLAEPSVTEHLLDR
jgi:adenylate kinase